MSRRFSRRQRTEIYLRADGLCEYCDRPVGSAFHIDHAKPYSRAGPTIDENGRLSCHECNLKKGNAMLLDHQSRFQDICRELKGNASLNRVIALVVCGGGKSIYGPIAAHELIPYRGDGLCWVVPRNNLRIQAEGNFTAPWLRNVLGHTLEIRSATNEVNPMRDKIGYCTSYQALVKASSYSRNPHLELFKQKRMILLLDEAQGVALDGATHDALKPLFALSPLIIFVSGCLSRNDNERIAGMNYLPPDAHGRSFIDLSNNKTQRFVEYSLGDATRDKQLIQIFFELRDAEANWEVEDTSTGQVLDESMNSFAGASQYKTSKGLMTALNTEFFESLLIEGTDYWLARRQCNRRSQHLVVCPSISSAQKALKLMAQRGIHDIDIATSEDDEKARIAIERFRHLRKPHLSSLVTVGMAYIGMDCPPADVLTCLTHIRSREWIEQMLHRVTRWDRFNSMKWEQQFATIFAPRDRFFMAIMDEIRAKQKPFVDDQIRQPIPGPPKPSDKFTHPNDSSMTNASSHTLEGAPIENDDHEELTSALLDSGLFGVVANEPAKRFFEAMNAQKAKSQTQPQQTAQQPEPDPVSTPSQRERELRKKIEDHKRRDYNPSDPYAADKLKTRGRAIFRIFGKPIDDLTETELNAVWDARSVWYPA